MQKGKPIIEKGPVQTRITKIRDLPLDRERYLKIQTDLIGRLNPPDGIPLGYCFSYPAIPTPDGDATLITWTKELFVPDTEGCLVGKMLLEQLHKQSIYCSSVTVINDTVASLMAGQIEQKADNYIALVVGTGTNMATFMEPDIIPKLKDDLIIDSPIPINLESGNFNPPHLTQWDNFLDSRSVNPGTQRFEKAVSGGYLGQLLKVIDSLNNFESTINSEKLVQLAYESHRANKYQSDLAFQILERSAKLVSASLAGLIKFLNAYRTIHSLRIVAEGGLISGAPDFKKTIEGTLKSLLSVFNLSEINIEFVQIDNSNLLGSAVAAVSE